jgi:hypothetical protein
MPAAKRNGYHTRLIRRNMPALRHVDLDGPAPERGGLRWHRDVQAPQRHSPLRATVLSGV